MNDTLYIVIPCYNEEKVLPITSQIFVDKMKELVETGKVSKESRILFVNDGSRDKTWEIIKDLSRKEEYIIGKAWFRISSISSMGFIK